MTHVVCAPCFGCKYTDCVVVCPVECFYEGEQILYIHPDECIDCEACVPECPVEAIFHEDNVPEEWKEFTALNAELAPTLPSDHGEEGAAGGPLGRQVCHGMSPVACATGVPPVRCAFQADRAKRRDSSGCVTLSLRGLPRSPSASLHAGPLGVTKPGYSVRILFLLRDCRFFRPRLKCRSSDVRFSGV